MVFADTFTITPVLKHLKTSFRSGKTLNIEYRQQQLSNLLKGLEELGDKFHQALKEDLNCSEAFSMIYSVGACISATKLCVRELSTWMQAKEVDTPLYLAPAKSYVYPEPYGVVLIIGAWNYPLIGIIPYLAYAISAGNCAIVKPSEISKNSSKVIFELCEKYLDKDCYRCVEVDAKITQEILKEKFDMMVFTGNPQTGKIIAKAAAENLVPCILELGGKCPTIVNKEADIENAALRIARARLLNAGQSCIACDYVFVHKNIKLEFIEALKKKIIQFYGENPLKSSDYAKIINIAHTERLKSYLDEDHGGKVLMGGDVNVKEQYVAPTLIDSPSVDSKLMQDEIFGPILPIYEFSEIRDVLEFINDRPKPLATYYYGSEGSEAYNLLKTRTSSGALVCNDSFTQATNVYLPFGGVGASGQGKLNGYHGFKSLSHFKSVMECHTNNGFPASVLFPPYTETTKKVLKYSGCIMFIKQKQMYRMSLLLILALLLFTLYKSIFFMSNSMS